MIVEELIDLLKKFDSNLIIRDESQNECEIVGLRYDEAGEIYVVIE